MKIKTEMILRGVAIGSLLVGLTIMGAFAFFLYQNYSYAQGGDLEKIMETTGNVGDFFGGAIGSFWALTGVFLLYLTLKMQKEELVNQREELRSTREVFEIQSFENTFFNLLQQQKSILNELNVNMVGVDNDASFYLKDFAGMDLFHEIKNQFNYISKILDLDFKIKFETAEYQRIIDGKIEFPYTYNLCSQEAKKINDLNYKETVKLTQKYIALAFYSQHYNITPEEQTIYKECIDFRCRLIFAIFSARYDQLISHYFKNLYRILQLIESTEEKLNKSTLIIKFNAVQYAKILRAQLTLAEQLVIYYSISCYPVGIRLSQKYELCYSLPKEMLLDQSHNNSFGINLTKSESSLREEILNQQKVSSTVQ